MSSYRDLHPEQQNKLVAEPPIAASDDHAQQVAADERFQAALDKASLRDTSALKPWRPRWH